MITAIAAFFGSLREIFGFLKDRQLIEAGKKEAQLESLKMADGIRKAADRYVPPDSPWLLLRDPKDRGDPQ